MPRSPLPAREAEICQRLRIWREQRGISRVQFAEKVGLRADSYSAYEYARAPVRYELAQRIFAWFNINAKWLATGVGPLNLATPTPLARELGISPREAFSSVYDRLLVPDVEKRNEAAIERLRLRHLLPSSTVDPPTSSHERVLLEEALQSFLRECFSEFPADDLAAFVGGIMNLAAEIGYASMSLNEEEARRRRAEMDAACAFIARRRQELGMEYPPLPGSLETGYPPLPGS